MTGMEMLYSDFLHMSHCLDSVRNNGRTLDIYRPNEAFVRPFLISPDILSGGVAAGVEFRTSNPHPRTSQCYVNNRSFRTKQTQSATRYMARAERVFC